MPLPEVLRLYAHERFGAVEAGPTMRHMVDICRPYLEDKLGSHLPTLLENLENQAAFADELRRLIQDLDLEEDDREELERQERDDEETAAGGDQDQSEDGESEKQQGGEQQSGDEGMDAGSEAGADDHHAEGESEESDAVMGQMGEGAEEPAGPQSDRRGPGRAITSIPSHTDISPIPPASIKWWRRRTCATLTSCPACVGNWISNCCIFRAWWHGSPTDCSAS